MVKLAFISPIKHMEKAIEVSDINLALPHLIKKGNKYTSLFKESSKYTILDNGFFEFGDSLGGKEMVKKGHLIGANCLVLPDYTDEYINFYKEEGFEVMYIPKNPRDFVRAMEDSRYDKVGVSEIPLIKYYNKGRYNPFVRSFLFEHFWKSHFDKNKVHMLGASNLIEEIAYCKDYIGSYDSSAGIWAGLHYKSLIFLEEKFTTPVDFNSSLIWTPICDSNIKYIKRLAGSVKIRKTKYKG